MTLRQKRESGGAHTHATRIHAQKERGWGRKEREERGASGAKVVFKYFFLPFLPIHTAPALSHSHPPLSKRFPLSPLHSPSILPSLPPTLRTFSLHNPLFLSLPPSLLSSVLSLPCLYPPPSTYVPSIYTTSLPPSLPPSTPSSLHFPHSPTLWPQHSRSSPKNPVDSHTYYSAHT